MRESRPSGSVRAKAEWLSYSTADFLRIDPALRLALGKDHQAGASQSMLSRLENDILGNEAGLQALEAALTRSTARSR